MPYKNSSDRQEETFNSMNLAALKQIKNSDQMSRRPATEQEIIETLKQNNIMISPGMSASTSIANGMYDTHTSVSQDEPVISQEEMTMNQEPQVPEVKSTSNLIDFQIFNWHHVYYFEYFAEVMNRIAQFVVDHEINQGSYSSYLKNVQYNFLLDNPEMSVILILQQDVIIGHCLIESKMWQNELATFVTQLKCDLPLPRVFAKKLGRYWKEFACRLGCKKVLGLVHDKDLVTLYREYFEAKTTGVIMSMDVGMTDFSDFGNLEE